MCPLFCTDEVIEEIVLMNCGQHATLREKHVLRESLRNLVRIAKVEEAGALRINTYAPLVHPDEIVLH